MIIYTVLEGDTLLSIAQSYNTTVSRIAADNRLDPALPLVVGQTLVILYPEEIYTAREGDTVLSIARAFGVSAVEIWQNNPILSGQNALFPGQTIVISYGAPSYGEISLLGYAYTYIDDELLRRTLPYLTYLSVFPYGLEADGSIVIPEGDDRLITTAKEYNTLPLMTLTSLTVEGVFSTELINSILASPTLSERVIQNAVSLVQSKGLGGVDMDFEFISPEYRENYADFIRRLKEALGDGYVVFTDLAPKTRDDQPGLLYEAHDYSSLGTFSDKLFLMTYEWDICTARPERFLLSITSEQLSNTAFPVYLQTRYLWGSPHTATTGHFLSCGERREPKPYPPIGQLSLQGLRAALYITILKVRHRTSTTPETELNT